MGKFLLPPILRVNGITLWSFLVWGTVLFLWQITVSTQNWREKGSLKTWREKKKRNLWRYTTVNVNLCRSPIRPIWAPLDFRRACCSTTSPWKVLIGSKSETKVRRPPIRTGGSLWITFFTGNSWASVFKSFFNTLCFVVGWKMKKLEVLKKTNSNCLQDIRCLQVGNLEIWNYPTLRWAPTICHLWQNSSWSTVEYSVKFFIMCK